MTVTQGMDFQWIQQVILYMEPCTFNLLVQKIGQCVRIFTELGEVIVFITKTSLKLFLVEFELDSVDNPERSTEEDPDWEEHVYDTAEGKEEDDIELEVVTTDDCETDLDEDEEMEEVVSPEATPVPEAGSLPPAHQTKCKKVLTHIEAHDQWFLLWFLTTDKCC